MTHEEQALSFLALAEQKMKEEGDYRRMVPTAIPYLLVAVIHALLSFREPVDSRV